jgi:hypothetical protein
MWLNGGMALALFPLFSFPLPLFVLSFDLADKIYWAQWAWRGIGQHEKEINSRIR